MRPFKECLPIRVVLPRFNQSVKILPVKQQPTQFPMVPEGDPHPLKDASRQEVPDGPPAHAEIGRSRLQIQEPRGGRNNGYRSQCATCGPRLLRALRSRRAWNVPGLRLGRAAAARWIQWACRDLILTPHSQALPSMPSEGPRRSGRMPAG